MKKNKFLLVVFVLLGITTVLFVFKNKFGTIREELKDFSVKDTASITKVFLADRYGKSITLSREANKQWLVNNKYNVRRSNILNLLEVLYRIDVRTKVAKAAYNNVIKALSSNGIKCEIYFNNKTEPGKVIYIGGQTEDGLGTFMMLENSNSPFITQIPGFNGYLTPRFSPIEKDWREPLLFSLPESEIRSISIDYANFPENSFLLSANNGRYNVSSSDRTNTINHVDSIACDNYLYQYKNVYYEDQSSMEQKKIDSIIALPSPIKIELTDVKGQKTKLDIYPVPVTGASLAMHDSTGNLSKFDVDRVYGYLQPEKLFVTIQQQNIEKLFRRRLDFDLDKNRLRH